MQSNIGARRHSVIEPEIFETIEFFFGSADWKGLYLTGGTCLAEFYFGHRTSVDIDLYTMDEKLFEAARRALVNPRFFPFGNLEGKRSLPGFCEYLLIRRNKDPIKIDLMVDVPIQLGKKVRLERIWIDSLPDLLSNKLGCLIQREDVKDFIDLFYLIPALDPSVEELIDIGRKKDAGIDPIILAEQMLFIQGFDEAPDYFRANVPWLQIKGFFARLREDVLDYARSWR